MIERIGGGIVVAMLVMPALAACGSGGGGTASGSGFCAEAKKVQDDPAFQQLDLSDKAATQRALDEMKKLQAAAPSEIKDDVNTIANVLQTIKDGGADTMTEADGKKAQAANARVETYLKDKCGIDISNDTTVTTGG